MQARIEALEKAARKVTGKRSIIAGHVLGPNSGFMEAVNELAALLEAKGNE